LRLLARQGQLFWIRIVGATVGFATLAFLLLGEVHVGAGLGAQIFHALNAILFFTILSVGPLLTCDCIAREKREGTLGLLFLAPLSGRAIVFSKVAVNAVRAFTLLLAILPMMSLPLVFGGITGQTVATIIMQQITALSVALSAGILASTMYRNFIQTAVLAEIFCVGFFLLTAFFLPITPLAGTIIGVMSVVIVVEYCSTALKQKWEEESSNYKEPFWVRGVAESTTARFLFKWDTRRARSANPMAWLQEYSWSARLAKWGWFWLAIFAELREMLNWAAASTREATNGQQLLTLALLLGISFTAASSFRQERITGALELLLVTPLTPGQIIFGRLWGIWAHFLPAVLVVTAVWFTTGLFLSVLSAQVYVVISSLLFLPMIGLFVSLLPLNLLLAWVLVFLVGVVLPVYFSEALFGTGWSMVSTAIILQASAGTIALVKLWKKLQNRSFEVQ
jgi:ABC-type transport system involved in multi-copper enzyme maturation permease subunit